MDRLSLARVIARLAHHGQVDKRGVAYFAHVEDVARRVKHLSVDHEIVGLLHDSIEDTALELADVEGLFGSTVSAAIDAMTKRKGEDYLEAYLSRLKANPIAVAVKIADSSHNLSKAHLISDPEEQQRLRRRYGDGLSKLGVDPASAERPLIYDASQQRWVEKACPLSGPASG